VYGIEAVCLRYANIYGPRQNPEGEAGVVAIFATRMLRGEQPVVNGDGKQTRDYVFVGDIVRANVMALGLSGFRVLNVGTGIETDVNMLFREIRRLTRSECEERHGEAKKGEQLRSVLSAGSLKELSGWAPSVALSEGLDRTVAYFKESRNPG
jgi:UDP-glucose 4-epimerase